MADIFISYSKMEEHLTLELARQLEDAGYSIWWDTRLLPGADFPEEIKGQLDAAKAVIVIWTKRSVKSRWVRAEATLADEQKKLITVRDAAIDFKEIPLPFNTRQTVLVTAYAKIFAALASMQITPSENLASVNAAAKEAAEVEKRQDLQKEIAGAADRETLLKLWPADPEAVSNRLKDIGFIQALAAAGATPQWLKAGERLQDIDFAPVLVAVPHGSFMMGSKDGEGSDTERPRHLVKVPNALAVGMYPVTFSEWDAAVAAGGVTYKPRDEGWGRGRRPVINVSWNDAQHYIKWLSDRTGHTYRLLSEAEWEYTCRGGTATAYAFGNTVTRMDAQFSERTTLGSAGRTVEVGSFNANAFGLFDMHGNVWEWCEDNWHDSYEAKPKELKVTGAAWNSADNTLRVLRGGSYVYGPEYMRSTYRSKSSQVNRSSSCGFRIAREL